MEISRRNDVRVIIFDLLLHKITNILKHNIKTKHSEKYVTARKDR